MNVIRFLFFLPGVLNRMAFSVGRFLIVGWMDCFVSLLGWIVVAYVVVMTLRFVLVPLLTGVRP